MRLGLGEGSERGNKRLLDPLLQLWRPYVVWASRVTCKSKEGVLVGYEGVVTGDVGTVLELE